MPSRGVSPRSTLDRGFQTRYIARLCWKRSGADVEPRGSWVRVSYFGQGPERALATYSKGEITIVQIVVRDNNVEQALKALKKKMQREGTFREMKRRNHFEKPSEKKARQKAEAIRRARKLARKRAQREGLLPKRGGGRR